MEQSFPGRGAYRLATFAVLMAVRCLADGTGGGADALKPEMTAGQGLSAPSEPLRVRFTLMNPTDEVIEVPEIRVAGTEVSLPLSVVYGDPSKPALSAGQDGAKLEPLKPEKPLGPETGDQPLRLGPRASIGTEVDLRAMHRELRYVGSHKLEWKPLGGKIGTATLELRIEPRKNAVLSTDYGKITFTLFYDKAPLNVENFLELCRSKKYEGSQIHRIKPGIYMQGGKPAGQKSEMREDGKTVPAEFNDSPFDLGTLAMALARVPGTDNFAPNSASCQFIIGLRRMPDWDGMFTVIGQAQATDDESLRTLRRLSELPTDANGQPNPPVRVVHFLLLDVESPHRVELSR